MNTALLPVEVSETIIDFCRRDPDIWEGPKWVWQSYARLTACALTCRDWLPRSRQNLFTIVILTDPTRFDTFATSVFNNPYLGEFVCEIRVQSHNKYIPFAMTELIRKLPNVRSLVFDADLSLYPPRYTVLTAQYSVTSLSIWDLSLFPSWSSLFNFIWAFPELSTLRLGSHLDGLPGKADKVDELTTSQATRISAIARRGRCHRLKTLELDDIWYLCPAFPPTDVFGHTLEKLTVRVGERATRAEHPVCIPPVSLFKCFANFRELQTFGIHLTKSVYASAEDWRHERMAAELEVLVLNVYRNPIPLRNIVIRFAASPTKYDPPLTFNARLLLGTYFQHLFMGPIRMVPSWRFLRSINIQVPSNDLPRSCASPDLWDRHLRAMETLPYGGDIDIAVSLYKAYSYLDPDEPLPPTWYCVRHRDTVSATVCSEECFTKGPRPYDLAGGVNDLPS